MQPVLLIVAFYVLFVFILYRWNRKKPAGLSLGEISFAYALKIVLGCAYGYIFLHWFHGDDTWYFHQGSIEEQRKLISDPWLFFADINPVPAFQRNDGLTEGWYFYLSDMEFWMLTKPMALFNFISQGNYYVNVVLFNFVVICGHIWLFRLYVTEFPEKRRVIFITLFLLPSIVFWLSGIRGDGLILFFLGWLLIRFHQWVHGQKHSLLISIIVAIGGIIILRSVLVVLLLPALFTWFVVVRFKTRIWLTTVVVYGLVAVAFFGSTLLSSEKNMPLFVVRKQAAYFKLRGNTRLELDTLQPTVKSFATVFPQAARNTFLRPYVWEAKGVFQLAAAVEAALLIVLLGLFLAWREEHWRHYLLNPLVFFPCLFALTLYLFIGYTIPFPGAFVRYKIPGELFLILALLLAINWKKGYKLK